MLLVAQTLDVNCVDGCGGDSTVTIIGLVVAFISLGIALKAWQVSERGLRIANTEHQVFMKQLNARADFELDLYLVHPSGAEGGGLIETNQPEIQLKWQMGITNSGKKAANDVGVNFLIPRELTKLVWVTQSNSPITDSSGRYGPMTSAEELPGSDDSKHPAWYLIKIIDRVSRIGAQVSFASAKLTLPNVGDERVVPVKFKVWSDDLPEDVGERILTMETIVRRVA